MILVAGGTGRLGSLVATRLSEAGQQVRVLSRGMAGQPGVLPTAVEVRRGDVREPAGLAAAVDGVEVVVSCVQGFVGPDGVTPTSVDKQGNFNLVDAAKQVGADFVLVSMTGAAADSPMELARAKYAAEKYLRASGLDWTIVRGAAFAQAWLGIVAQTAGPSGRPLVFGRGDNPIPWVDVAEVAALVERAVLDPSLRGQTLEICGPEALTLMQLAQAYMDHNGVAGRPRRVPRPMLRVMAGTVGRFKPETARQARAALAMDELPAAEDSATRARFPDLPRRPVSEVIAEVGAGVR
ncbi:MAG TPA: SDR family oxidoreductase [Nocardioidaceae bacterium]|nr:SDR family oxidoreductase [Nocardioidaceae bacterium]